MNCYYAPSTHTHTAQWSSLKIETQHHMRKRIWVSMRTRWKEYLDMERTKRGSMDEGNDDEQKSSMSSVSITDNRWSRKIYNLHSFCAEQHFRTFSLCFHNALRHMNAFWNNKNEPSGYMRYVRIGNAQSKRSETSEWEASWTKEKWRRINKSGFDLRLTTCHCERKETQRGRGEGVAEREEKKKKNYIKVENVCRTHKNIHGANIIREVKSAARIATVELQQQ